MFKSYIKVRIWFVQFTKHKTEQNSILYEWLRPPKQSCDFCLHAINKLFVCRCHVCHKLAGDRTWNPGHQAHRLIQSARPCWIHSDMSPTTSITQLPYTVATPATIQGYKKLKRKQSGLIDPSTLVKMLGTMVLHDCIKKMYVQCAESQILNMLKHFIVLNCHAKSDTVWSSKMQRVQHPVYLPQTLPSIPPANQI